MNPLDAREQIQIPEDTPYEKPPGGIPGFVSSDAIVAAYVALLQDQAARKNTMIQGIYGNLIQHWKDNNSRGIYDPAPGPMILVSIDPAAAAAHERTGVGAAKIFQFQTMWDPDAPPGTIAKPPVTPPPTSSDAGVNPVGPVVPGTDPALRKNLGGPYKAYDLDPSQKYMLVNFSPMNEDPGKMFWKAL